MRKRSDVAAADPRQQNIPGTTPAPAASPPPPPPSSPRPRSTTLPDHVTVDHGTVFIKCPDCGLNQSSESAKRKTMPNGASLLHCMRCNGLIDPDEELTEDFIARLKTTYANGSAAPKPPPAQEPAKSQATKPEPPPPAAKAPTIKPCVQCGAAPTETSAGVFFPCGHPQDKTAAPKRARHEVPVVESDGETVTACFGEEKFSPRQYQNFAIGPYFRSTKVQPGETPAQALTRANEELRVFANVEFQQKAKDFLDRLAWLDEELRNRGGAR